MATRPRSTTRSRSRSPKPSDALLGDRPVPVQNPLPKAQLAAVYTIKLVVPIAAMQIAPYMNQMIEDLHLSGAKGTGYYSGLVGTAAAVTQLLSVYPWARLSGKIILQMSVRSGCLSAHRQDWSRPCCGSGNARASAFNNTLWPFTILHGHSHFSCIQ